MNFWLWLWHLLGGLPWGMVAPAIAGVLLVVIGIMELMWRLFRGVGALTYAWQQMRENSKGFAIDWCLWTGLITTVGVFGVCMFAFYVMQIEQTAVLPIEWRDGRRFLLCATLGSWIFGLAVFKLLKGEIDWRLTAVFFMLGWLCIAGAGSWLRVPAPFSSLWNVRAAVVAGLVASAFTWQTLVGLVSIIELIKVPEQPAIDPDVGRAEG